VGLQQRSGMAFLKAKKEIIDAGLLGKIAWVQTVWHLGAPYELGPADDPKPTDLDWGRFLGQVAWREWNAHQYHHYRLYLDFGGGAITDLFTHWIDVVHMFMGQDTPKSVTAAGGIYIAKDDRTAPDTINIQAEYDGFNVTFESTALPSMPEEYIAFHGTEGTLLISRLRYEFRSKEKGVEAAVYKAPMTLDQDHIRNFLEACRSRRTPNSTLEQGHRAAQVCILAKKSYVLKRRIGLEALNEITS
jgi:predicted dehydrogenase